MKKFPSIREFRSTVHTVGARTRYVGRDADDQPIYDHSRGLPTLPFRGSIKLHGTNVALSYDTRTGELAYQGRTRILTVADDNQQFVLQMTPHEAWIKSMFQSLDVGPCDLVEALKRGMELERSK